MKLLSLHKRALGSSLLKIVLSPFEHILNILSIGIIVAVLSSTYIVGKNINNLEQSNVTYPQIMVTMQENAIANDVAYIEAAVNKISSKSIRGYKFISREDGLKQLQNDEELKKIASDSINDMGGIVPDVLIINTSTADVKLLNNIKNKISNLPKVESVDVDNNYASKVSDLINFAKIAIEFAEGLFAVLLVLVVYNIIRLQMLLRHDEISVSRLIGASDAFIMRPLVYYSLIQILLGALLAFYLVNALVKLLNYTFINLSNLFGKDFIFHSLSISQMLNIFLILAIFSTFAVFIAVKMVFRNTYVQ